MVVLEREELGLIKNTEATVAVIQAEGSKFPNPGERVRKRMVKLKCDNHIGVGYMALIIV